MDTVSSMMAFVRVAAVGSFTAAANELQVSIPHVSRSVRYLEDKVRARLINRSTRRLTLTEVGRNYLVHARQILAHIEEAEAEAAAFQDQVGGVLKIAVSAEFSQGVLVRAVSQFCELYPDVRVDLATTFGVPDPTAAGYDAALIVDAQLPDLEAYYQQLGVCEQFICASPSYLRLHGVPTAPEHLGSHKWIRMRQAMKVSSLKLSKAGSKFTVAIENFTLEACSMASLTQAVSLGMGLAVLPGHEMIEHLRKGDMVNLLPGFNVASRNIYSLYPAHQYLPKKTRAWLSFLKNYNFGLSENGRFISGPMSCLQDLEV